MHLDRVAIDPLAGTPHGPAEALALLLEPDTPALEDAHPRLGGGLGEEGEMHAEGFVFPRRRAGLAEQLGEPFLAIGGQRVHDLAAPAPAGGIRRHPSCGLHAPQGRVERAVGEGTEGAEQRVEALAQLVAVQGGLGKQPQHSELEHCHPLSTRRK